MTQSRSILADGLVLGTAQFGADYGIANESGRPSAHEVFKVLEYAWEQGVRRFDTAPEYGSEALLGNFIKANGIERELVVLTKVSGLKCGTDYRTQIGQSLDLSRKRLNTDIDTVFFHDPADSSVLLEDAEFHRGLLDTSQINHIGVSVYDPVEVERLVGCELELAFQFPLNLVDRRFEDVKMIPGKRYARSIFLQGLLVASGGLRTGANPELVNFHRRYHGILKDHCVDSVGLALSFVSHSSCQDYLVVGVNRVEELREILTTRIEDAAYASLIESFAPQPPREVFDPRTWINSRAVESL